ncbi:MAG TPA: DUF370 domain-containing protein [Candidatus Omnitrophica bacterium]|nr:MAG: hypothetical protein DRP61_01900 [Candidatus Omnitrophota bacterium]RKY35814.1 MAG: hypothetical protein DRP69_00215 [Candidatus Omnitrophota bacterium]HEC69388.1 DUF370 domain-containing protein [Candidatus Omnitrophota bacterium]
MMEIINLGYNNVVLKNRVVAILGLNSSPLKRLVDIARKENKLIDATSGRKTRSIILTDTGFIILSSLQPQRLAQRIKEK